MGNQLIQVVDNAIKDSKSLVIDTIKQYKWELVPDSQLQAAKTALTKNDYIMKIAAGDSEAVRNSVIQSSILGLDLTEGKRQGWLLPRKNQFGKMVIQLQVGYKGVEAIHQRMGVIDRLVIRIVRHNDEFDWSGDDQEKPNHKADWFKNDEERGQISGAFSITYFPDKTIQVMVKPISEIYEKHRDISDSWRSYQAKIRKNEKAFPPPWVTFEAAMVEKTMSFIAAKQWPANIRDSGQASKILETLHEVDTADYTSSFSRYTPEQKAIFTDILNAEDELGFYLFYKTIMKGDRNMEIWSDLTGDVVKAIPRGGKIAMKDRFKEMEKIGRELYENAITAISGDDRMMFIENVDGALPITKKALMSELTQEQKSIVDEFFGK